MSKSTIPENRLRPRTQGLRTDNATPAAKVEAVDNGLPPWMTHPRNLCIAFLCVVFTLNQVRLGMVNTSRRLAEDSQKTQVTDCVTFPSAPGSQPVVEPVYDPQNPHHHMRSLLGLTEKCIAEGCTGHNKKNYVSSLSGFMWVRLADMEKSYNVSGAAGLRSQFKSTQTRRDYTIIDGAREIIKSGELNVTEIGDIKSQNFLELVIKHRIDPIPVCATGTTERIKY
jgi:hypothetical protein